MMSPAPHTVLRDRIERSPKVVLHDHLDGGVRPTTLIDLADDCGYTGLHTRDPGELAAWVSATARGGDLGSYLRTFEHTLAVLQRPDALQRVAAEAVLDLAHDSVVYAELRFAPELHLSAGLNMADAVAAVCAGVADGEFLAAVEGLRIHARVLVCGMRTDSNCLAAADAAAVFHGRGVAGFDIAGNEVDSPPSLQLAAFNHAHAAGVPVTIHAGEAEGVPFVFEAVSVCSARRVGHGIAVAEDLTVGPDGEVVVGEVAALLLGRGVHLEICPSSNVHTGAVPAIEHHPVAALSAAGFLFSINADNRLMSATTTSQECVLVAESLGWGEDLVELEAVAVNALSAAFVSEELRSELLTDVIRPRFEALRSEPVAW
jgi:adenosine deaminase